VWPDGAKFRHLGEIFWRWAHFFLKNIAQMICAQLFSVRSPKFHLHNLYIMATFCLLISIFWSGEKVLFGKAPFWALFRSKFGAFFTTRRVTLFTSEGWPDEFAKNRPKCSPTHFFAKINAQP
jgi:hypothetical protein